MMVWKYGAKSSFVALHRLPIAEIASDCTDGMLRVSPTPHRYFTEHRLYIHCVSGSSTFLKIFLLIISHEQNCPTQDAAIACTRRHGFFCTSCSTLCSTCAPHFFWNVTGSATDT